MVWYWHTDKWNRIKRAEINPNIYGQLIFDKVAKSRRFTIENDAEKT